MRIIFRPKLLECLPNYSRAQFGKDLASGITVGVLALPLAMAFAIASGCSPTAGIWTGIVAGLLTSLFGGSRVQIGGPTGAFIPIVYGIVAAHGFVNLLGATMLAGAFLLAMGIARMGQLIRFIPVTVVIGSLVVMSHERVVGILTFREVIQAAVRNGGSFGNTSVYRAMNPGPLICTLETELDEVRRMMVDHHARYLPVIEKQMLQGVISFYDVAKTVVDRQDFENRMLKAYIRDWPEDDGKAEPNLP